MYKGLGLLSADADLHLRAEPRLNLLLELEPAYRVFFRNLFDRLLFRTVPRIEISWKPARFWGDVFVYSGVAWWAFLESMFWHLLTVLLVVALYPRFAMHRVVLQRKPIRNSLVYYPPPQSFPATGGAAERPTARAAPRHQPAPQPRQAPMAVAREQRPALVTPPDLASAAARLPDLGAANPTLPTLPPSAIGRSQLPLPAGPSAAVVPPPSAGTSAGTTRRGIAGPAAAAVAPPPVVASSISGRRAGEGGLGRSVVVGPSPQLPGYQRRALPGGAPGNPGGTVVAVVPPPPSIHRSGIPGAGAGGSPGGNGQPVVPPPPLIRAGAGSSGRGGGGSLSSSRFDVVPPPPSLKGTTGAPGGSGHGSWQARGGWSVVPPPPSLNGTGDPGGGGRSASLGGGGSEVVPPPPSLRGDGGSGGTGHGGIMASAASVVPPPPSLDSAGAGAGGARGSGLSGGGSQVVPPPPSFGGTGEIAGGGRGNSLSSGGSDAVAPPAGTELGNNLGGGGAMGMGGAPPILAPPSSPATDSAANSPVMEEPVRLIGLAFFLPGSSYFSSYEVFIAERKLSKNKTELIKLVYTFLPYQRRLSEYGLHASGVYKLRVRRDPSCDETLLQMTWHQTNQTQPQAQALGDVPAASANGKNNLLPCYLTTADDYKKALSKSH